MGYKNLTGKSADFIHVYKLDNNNRDTKMSKSYNMDDLTKEIETIAIEISNNNMKKKCLREKYCKCFVARLYT